MNGKRIKFTGLFIVVLLVGLSLSSNPPNGRTGAPGDSFCTDCHGNPSTSIDGFIDISGVPSTIEANTTYTLTVTSEFTSGSPTRAGFQMVVLDDGDEDVGTLSNPSASSTITPSGGRTYFEHNPSLNFGGSSSVSWEVDWTAPAGPDMTDITFYASTILANGSGGNSTDKMKLTNVSGTLEASTLPLAVEIIEQVPVSCFGFSDGFALAEGFDGTPPYDFEWSNGETDNPAIALSPGIISVTVTDSNGETSTVDGFIETPDELSLVFEEIDVTCFGLNNGMILTSASGGTGDYNYSWSDGSDNADLLDLGPGSYDLTLSDENDCEVFFTFQIEEPDPIIISSFDLINADCTSLGSIEIFTEGGTGTLNANWDIGIAGNNITDLEPGSYSVMITDENNCQIIEDFIIEGPEELNYNTFTTDMLCNGDNDAVIDLVFDSPSDYSSISWSTGETSETISNLLAGTYSVTIVDNFQCEYEETFIIEEPSSIQITDVTIVDVSCGELGSIEIVTIGGTGTLGADWDTGAIGNTITDLPAGDYTVEVYDENNCSIFETFTVEQNDNIDYQTESSNLTCNGSSNGTISLIFQSASDYESILWSTGETTETLIDLTAGTYSATITDADFCETIETFILTEPIELTLSATQSNQILCAGGFVDTLQLNTTGGTAPYTLFTGTTPINSTLLNVAPGAYDYNVVDANGCTDAITVTIDSPSQMVADITTSNTTSQTSMDGTATITMTGGTGLYSLDGSQFVEMTTITGLAPGLYQFNVSDINNCILPISFTISDGSVPCDDLNLDLSVIQPTCVGEEPTFVPILTGGTSPYVEIFQSQSFYDGQYTVTYVDANNCSISQEITIGYTDAIAPTLTLQDITLYVNADGTIPETVDYVTSIEDNCVTEIDISITSPMPDCSAGPSSTTMEVLATDMIGNSTTGTFVLTLLDTIPPTIFCVDDTTVDACGEYTLPTPLVMDNCGTPTLTMIGPDVLTGGMNQIQYTATDAFGLTSTCSVIVTVNSPIFEFAVSTNDPACAGDSNGSYQVNVYSEGTVVYENGLFENLTAGTYSFSIVNDVTGCILDSSVTLLEPEALSISNEIIFPLSEGGASDGAIEIAVQGGTLPYSYSWLDQDGNEVSTDESANGLIEGIYHCNITDANGCLFKTQNYSISFDSSIEDSYLQQVDLYPNPFNKLVFIESPRQLDQLNVFNAQGKLVFSSKTPSNQINLGDLEAGVYMIEIIENEEKAFKRLIKQ